MTILLRRFGAGWRGRRRYLYASLQVMVCLVRMRPRAPRRLGLRSSSVRAVAPWSEADGAAGSTRTGARGQI